jgi:hypothetical protein
MPAALIVSVNVTPEIHEHEHANTNTNLAKRWERNVSR